MFALLGVITIFIDPTPPQGTTTDNWHNECCQAVSKWYGPLEVVTDKSKACIRFYSGDTKGNYGIMRGFKYLRYPHYPIPGDGIDIIVDTCCPQVRTTLLHEVGHTIGLKHRNNSIMCITTRPEGLTDLDKETIREYRSNMPIHLK